MVKITVDGVTYPLRASMKAWKEFETNTGTRMAEIGEADITKVPELLYYCAAAGARKEGNKFEVTLDDWMDAITTDDIVDMQEAIATLLGVKKK